MSGNPFTTISMRYAVGFYNYFINPSHFYDVLRNPNYNTGNPFPFLETFAWLDQSTSELEPLAFEEDTTVIVASKDDEHLPVQIKSDALS